jgi:adenine-specific DNA-methyltransferase
MLLNYKNKKTDEEILETEKARLEIVSGWGARNKLIQGDNLAVLKALIDDHGLRGKVNLVYIDPPFATNGHFRIGQGRTSTVSSSSDDEIAYSDVLVDDEFLSFLRDRLVLLRELMSPRGSIYLHIDYKIGHYVKLVMDEVFGREGFRNDITRIKCNPKNFDRKAYGNVKDLILFYTKTADPIWNDPREPLGEEDIERRFRKFDEAGRAYTTIPLHAPGETVNGKTGAEWKGLLPPKGRHWRTAPAVLEQWDQQGLIEWSKNGVPRKRNYADETTGKKIQDVWEFKDPQYPNYPTEKNLEMLKLIVAASSNEGDIVLDCFSGSGTTLVAAEALQRRWIGVDMSEHAMKVAKQRMTEPGTLFAKSTFELLVQKSEIPAAGMRCQRVKSGAPQAETEGLAVI